MNFFDKYCVPYPLLHQKAHATEIRKKTKTRARECGIGKLCDSVKSGLLLKMPMSVFKNVCSS